MLVANYLSGMLLARYAWPIIFYVYGSASIVISILYVSKWCRLCARFYSVNINNESICLLPLVLLVYQLPKHASVHQRAGEAVFGKRNWPIGAGQRSHSDAVEIDINQCPGDGFGHIKCEC